MHKTGQTPLDLNQLLPWRVVRLSEPWDARASGRFVQPLPFTNEKCVSRRHGLSKPIWPVSLGSAAPSQGPVQIPPTPRRLP